MIFPSFLKSEQNAILHLTAQIAYNEGWKENEQRLLNAIAHRFNFSRFEIGEAIMMDSQQAAIVVKAMDSEKKKLASCLFQSAAMADGDTRMGKPQWDRYFDFAQQCNIPMNITFSDALKLTHLYLEC
ncbi:MAG: hypothetical protein IKZ37_03730 [Bacteroidaceae bacterium]|nr:hypothetical protein [Bacteroidaceae bacterium]